MKQTGETIKYIGKLYILNSDGITWDLIPDLTDYKILICLYKGNNDKHYLTVEKSDDGFITKDFILTNSFVGLYNIEVGVIYNNTIIISDNKTTLRVKPSIIGSCVNTNINENKHNNINSISYNNATIDKSVAYNYKLELLPVNKDLLVEEFNESLNFYMDKLIKGNDSYVHIAYANSEDGIKDFSTTESLNKKFLGIYTNDLKDSSTDPTFYNWSNIKAETGYSIIIFSSNGNTFINGEGVTTLTAILYYGNEDITNTIASENFNWTMKSNNASLDEAWNNSHKGVGNNIIIEASDFYKSAMFECQIHITE